MGRTSAKLLEELMIKEESADALHILHRFSCWTACKSGHVLLACASVVTLHIFDPVTLRKS